MEDIMEILRIEKKGKLTNTLENFYIYKETKIENQIMIKIKSNKTSCLTQIVEIQVEVIPLSKPPTLDNDLVQ